MKPSASRRRLRFRLQGRAIAVLALIWVILWGNYSLLDFLVGIVLGWLITITFPLPPVRYHGRLHPLRALVLGLRTLRDLAVASWRLTVQAFLPTIALRPAVIRVDLRSNQDLYQVQTAELLSIVPGSIVMDARRSQRSLYLHLMDVTDTVGVEQARREALRVERAVVEAFGSADEIARIRQEPT